LIPEALAGSLYRLSRGVPRVINVLCDRALLGAFTKGRDRVSRSILTQAANEVFYRPANLRRSWVLPLSLILVLTIGGWVATVVQRYQEHVSARQMRQVNSVIPALPAKLVEPVGK
jgi:general secretion pathway protein A